jgi:hypothetical protein
MAGFEVLLGGHWNGESRAHVRLSPSLDLPSTGSRLHQHRGQNILNFRPVGYLSSQYGLCFAKIFKNNLPSGEIVS